MVVEKLHLMLFVAIICLFSKHDHIIWQCSFVNLKGTKEITTTTNILWDPSTLHLDINILFILLVNNNNVKNVVYHY